MYGIPSHKDAVVLASLLCNKRFDETFHLSKRIFNTIPFHGGKALGIILDLLNLAVYIPFLKVNEEDIGRNINYLKRHQWFQNYLNDKKYRELIIHSKDVRQVIGKFNSNKLKRKSYQKRCQGKLQKVLFKKLDNLP